MNEQHIQALLQVLTQQRNAALNAQAHAEAALVVAQMKITELSNPTKEQDAQLPVAQH